MFGRPTAAMHAIEPQGRKTLHGHLAFFGGMPASILQCGDDFDALKALPSITDIGYHLHRIFAKQVLCCSGDKTFDCPTTQKSPNTFTNEL